MLPGVSYRDAPQLPESLKRPEQMQGHAGLGRTLVGKPARRESGEDRARPGPYQPLRFQIVGRHVELLLAFCHQVAGRLVVMTSSCEPSHIEGMRRPAHAQIDL